MSCDGSVAKGQCDCHVEVSQLQWCMVNDNQKLEESEDRNVHENDYVHCHEDDFDVDEDSGNHYLDDHRHHRHTEQLVFDKVDGGCGLENLEPIHCG